MVTGKSQMSTVAEVSGQVAWPVLPALVGTAEREDLSENEKLQNAVEDDKTDDNIPPVLLKPFHI